MGSLKGSLGAPEACAAVRRGLLAGCPGLEVPVCPMADGGEGTAAIVAAARGAEWVRERVAGPLPGTAVEAGYAWLPRERVAVVEMAAASGLTLVPPAKRDPLRTTTAGTGELIRSARARGAARILLAIGGSATVDGGVGAAAALGWRFLDATGRPVGPGGGQLERIARIEPPARPLGAEVEVLCDVANPLCGPRGAAAVFGPQKGASPAAVARLDRGLRRLAARVRRDLGADVAALPGAGAAGGLGAGAVAFLGARLVPGVDAVMAATGLRAALAGAAWVVTGEGCLDATSLGGKIVSGVVREARRAGARVLVVAGRVRLGAAARRAAGIDEAIALAGPGRSARSAQARAAEALESEASAWARRLAPRIARERRAD